MTGFQVERGFSQRPQGGAELAEVRKGKEGRGGLVAQLREVLTRELAGRVVRVEAGELVAGSLPLRVAVKRFNREVLAEIYDQVYKVLLGRNFCVAVSLHLQGLEQGPPGGQEEYLLWLGKGHQSVQAARLLLREGFGAEALSRACHGIYCAARALLGRENVRRENPAELFREVGRLWVQTGRLDPYYHKMLMRLEDARRLADLDPARDVLPAEAAQAVREGEEMLAEAARLLGVKPEEVVVGQAG